MNIWQSLQKPILILAPMEGVSDTVFRQMLAKLGRPDLFYTEFTSTDGVLSDGSENVKKRFQFSLEEKPLIAQIWGNDPENFRKTAEMLSEMGFAGIDINMGCPVKDVVKKGSCSALIQTPELAAEIIKATKEGAGDLPVSVKTRIGYNEIESEKWCRFLLEQNIDALIVHGRTRKQGYKGESDWDEIGKVVEIKDELGVDTVIIGNGDVKSREEALEKVERYGVDGVMIGRGIFNNPWLFNKGNVEPSVEDRFQALINHLKLFQKTWRDSKNFNVMKKYFKMYINDFPGAKRIRIELMNAENPQQAIEICLKQNTEIGVQRSEVQVIPLT